MCLFSLQKLNFEIRLSVLRKDYKSMNKKIFVLFIVLILIVAIGFLFSYDKKVIEQEKQNTSEQLDNTEDVEQEVTEDDGFEEDLIGSLKIEKINLNGTVKEGSTNEILRDYIGHIEETAKYDGNVGLAAHNRGNKYSYFARINELEPGDEIVYTTKYGERKYIVDTTQKMHNLEEHTLCWLIKKNRSGELTEFGLRDAFYQDLHYDWGRQNVDVSKIEVVDGKPEIPAGYIPAEKSSTGKPIAVFQKPAVYNSGKRDTIVSNSIGRDVCLVGVPLDGFATPSDFVKMIKDRDGMADIMQSVLLKDPETKGWTAWREAPKQKVSLQQKVGAHTEQETVAGDGSKKQMSLQGNLNKINNMPPAFHQRLNEGSRS